MIIPVKKTRHYQLASRLGKKFFSKNFVIIYNPTPLYLMHNKSKNLNAINFHRIGITVSKKHGNAVKRNKIKRRIKSVFLKSKLCFKSFFDYIIIPKVSIANSNFEDILKEIDFCIRKINSINENLTVKKSENE